MGAGELSCDAREGEYPAQREEIMSGSEGRGKEKKCSGCGGRGRCGMMGESEALRIWARKVFGRGSVSSPGKVRRVDLI